MVTERSSLRYIAAINEENEIITTDQIGSIIHIDLECVFNYILDVAGCCRIVMLRGHDGIRYDSFNDNRLTFPG